MLAKADKKALAARTIVLFIIGLVLLLWFLMFVFKSQNKSLELIEQIKRLFG